MVGTQAPQRRQEDDAGERRVDEAERDERAVGLRCARHVAAKVGDDHNRSQDDTRDRVLDHRADDHLHAADKSRETLGGFPEGQLVSPRRKRAHHGRNRIRAETIARRAGILDLIEANGLSVEIHRQRRALGATVGGEDIREIHVLSLHFYGKSRIGAGERRSSARPDRVRQTRLRNAHQPVLGEED